MSGSDPEVTRSEGSRTEALPGLVRVAATAGLRTAEWGLQTYLRAGRRLLGAATNPSAALDLAEDIGKATRELAGIGGMEERVREAASGSDVMQSAGDAVQRVASAMPSLSDAGRRQVPEHTKASLQERGEELLRRSRDVWNDEDAHPAYERILEELAPDEGRILLLMLRDGPQPSIDVRTGGPLGLINSRLIAPGLSMIGGRAGLRYPDQVPSYLNNLFRLGMIWFSRETLQDPLPYQVVEAQPDVLEAMKSVRFAKIVRRSIHLTPFGEDFCKQCLALETAEMAALPGHAAPAEDDEVPTTPVVPGEE